MGAGVPFREFCLVLLVAAAVTFVTTGIIRYAVVRTGRLASIRKRNVHTTPKPRLGGVAMFAGFVVAMLVAGQLPALTRGFRPVTPEMDAVLWASAVIVLVGIIDDLWEMDPLTKLIGQLVGAVLMSVLGLSWSMLWLPGSDGGTTVILGQTQSTLITTFFVLVLINAVNFIDGLDGLATGLGMIAGLSLLLFALIVLHDQGGTVSGYPPAIIASGLIGMCLGFLPHNFEPSRIFMGDSGSMLIGLLLAAAATSTSGKINMSLYGPADFLALMSPIAIVAAAVFIPVLDLIMAVCRRLAKGQSPFKADKMHIHHRLLDLGHTHRRVVLILYTWCFVVAMSVVGFSAFPVPIASGLVLLGIALAILISLKPKEVRTGLVTMVAPEYQQKRKEGLKDEQDK